MALERDPPLFLGSHIPGRCQPTRKVPLRKRLQGKRTSRPPIPEATRRKIAELHGQGVSIKRIAKELKIAYGTAWNYIKGTSGDPIS